MLYPMMPTPTCNNSWHPWTMPLILERLQSYRPTGRPGWSAQGPMVCLYRVLSTWTWTAPTR